MIVFFWKKRGLGEGPLVKNLTQGVTQGFTRGFTKDFTEDFTKDLSNDFAKDFTKEFNKNLLRAQREGAQAPDASPIFTISGEKQFQNFQLFFCFLLI